MNGFEELTSIKGIGARSAAILLAGIGDVTDFPDADKLAADMRDLLSLSKKQLPDAAPHPGQRDVSH